MNELHSTSRSPHLSSTEVREMVGHLEQLDGEERREIQTRLAWRPAWAIRSRRGSLRILTNMLKDMFQSQEDSTNPSGRDSKD